MQHMHRMELESTGGVQWPEPTTSPVPYALFSREVNQMGHEGAAMFGEALQSNTSLRSLDLHGKEHAYEKRKAQKREPHFTTMFPLPCCLVQVIE